MWTKDHEGEEVTKVNYDNSNDNDNANANNSRDSILATPLTHHTGLKQKS